MIEADRMKTTETHRVRMTETSIDRSSSPLTLRTPVSRAPTLGGAADLCAAVHAGPAFALVHLPEAFEGGAVRKIFLQTNRSTNVIDCELEHVANGFVELRHASRR